jgi:ribosomal protein S18 acetylase RimI-like enzyme
MSVRIPEQSAIRIERMDASHLDAVAALEAQANLSAWGVAGYRRELDNPRAVLLVALTRAAENAEEHHLVAAGSESETAQLNDAPRDPRALAGFLAGWVVADEFELHTLGVARERRRRGVGAGLLRAGLRAAGARGAARCVLEVRAANAAALALYQRFGFVRIGARAGYYREPPGDALVLRCEGEAWAAMTSVAPSPEREYEG